MMDQTEKHWKLFAVISEIYIESRRITEEHLKPYKMTWPQFGALINLVREDDITQSELSEKISADQNTTMVLCNSLERKKWITRRREPSDKRVNKIVLTDAGRQAFLDAYPLVKKEYQLFTESISEEEIDVILPILSRVRSVIDRRLYEVKQ